MTAARAADLAALLATAHDTGTPVDPDALPAVDSVADGYRVQARLVDRLRAARGEPVGYKVGFTNERVRAELAVEEPSYGRLLADTVRSSPATVEAADFVGVRVEPEIAFRLADDLRADATRRAAREAVGAVVPAVELVDSRTDWTFDAPLAVADNSLDAGLVAGAGRDPTGIALADEAVTLRVDGSPVDSGVGGDVLGHPLAALTWLADAVGGLSAGALVTTGSLTEPLAVAAGETVRASFASLGDVELRVE
ncbi:2-keto-4-pentenoate hydratase [Halobaculum lipolyticum]|uniref:2-keto-4-pentenoate hydratase n=1 Tax=Halobaculum lipolyticum TaxID=3032001 RepID=A0ABD5WBQ1_9EURY|nr:fumarylacetoacetate hydrolase family protein [Halobaculum sp. DT31]